MSRVIILSAGSSSIKALLLDDLTKQILQKQEAKLDLQSDPSPERLLKNFLITTQKLLVNLFKEHRQKIKDVHCFLFPTFYAAQTQTTKRLFPEIVVFNPKLESEINHQTKIKLDGHHLIENFILGSRFNGYEVKNPYHQKVKLLEIDHYLSFVPNKILKSLEGLIAGVVKPSKINFYSSVYPIAKTLQKTGTLPKNYLFLHLDGEVSELTLVWQKQIKKIASFPAGDNWCLRRLAKSFATTPSEVSSMWQLYSENRMTSKFTQQMAQELEKLSKEWREIFQQSLVSVIENALLPQEIYIMGSSQIITLVNNWLSSAEPISLGWGSSKLTVKIVPLEAEKIFYDTIMASN